MMMTMTMMKVIEDRHRLCRVSTYGFNGLSR